MEDNPAVLLKRPIIHEKPTLPFSRAEVELMKANASGTLLTFILVLRYSGLRISDVALLRSSALNGDKLFLLIMKNSDHGRRDRHHLLSSRDRRLPRRDDGLRL